MTDVTSALHALSAKWRLESETRHRDAQKALAEGWEHGRLKAACQAAAARSHADELDAVIAALPARGGEQDVCYWQWNVLEWKTTCGELPPVALLNQKFCHLCGKPMSFDRVLTLSPLSRTETRPNAIESTERPGADNTETAPNQSAD